MCAVVKSEFPARASSADFQKENQRNSAVEHPQVIFCRRFYFYEEKLVFTPQPLRAVGVLFSPMVSGWAVGRVVGNSLSGLYLRNCKV